MTDDDFDPKLLRSAAEPRRPSPVATEAIRAAMLSAFDDEFDAASGARSGDADAADVDDDAKVEDTDAETSRRVGDRRLELVLDAESPTDGAPPARRTSRSVLRFARYGAVAALIAAAIAGIVIARADEPVAPLDTLDSDVAAVAQFCVADVEPLVDDLLLFEARPGGEASDRALRNGELLAQRYRDLASSLSDDLAADVATTGDELLEQAADARRTYTSTFDDDVIADLVGDTVSAIAALPGSGSCRLDGLQDSST